MGLPSSRRVPPGASQAPDRRAATGVNQRERLVKQPLGLSRPVDRRSRRGSTAVARG
jgi:hypothetical protein